FTERLESQVAEFDAAGRPFVQLVLDVAYEYELPLGLEYVDADAMKQPMNLKLRNERVREVLLAAVAQLPQYRLEVTPHMLKIYSPKARSDSCNLLNTTIHDFKCLAQSPRMASMEVYAAMMSQLHVPCCEAGDVLDSGHPRTVSLDLQDKKVYELLNAIVAQNGETVWVALVPPEKLSDRKAKLWEIYGLGPGWERILLRDLRGTFGTGK
ncbi:MAG: hypothetical protein DMG25_00685, partial [Acidobacteria bacterium]